MLLARQRLMTVPGIGPIISSAMVAAIGTGDVSSKGRDFGAWLGLVPKQISTGDRTILGKISRRGNRYLRVLFVQAAWVVLVRIKNWERYGLKSWIEPARRRLHHNVLAIALYPVYDWMASWLGGRRRLAALLLTILNLLIVIGPATWLTLGLIDSIRNLSEHLDLSALMLPPPPHAVKTWPIIGNSIYQFWDLASTNFQVALAKTAPLLKPLGGILLGFAEGAGIGVIKFFIAIVLAGFLFSPAPSLVNAISLFSRRLASGRGEKFVQLAGATIRAVSRGSLAFQLCKRF